MTRDATNVTRDAANGDPEVDATKPEFAFAFSFVTAGRVSEIIRKLKSTEAMGVDSIPTSILKKGTEVLAGPLAHLVNMSLATGKVPKSFKTAKVFPVFKGKGKKRDDPASYRPVSILPAMSKIMEAAVKADLEHHLAKVGGLPSSQYGFRPGRSCTSALAHAQAAWLKAVSARRETPKTTTEVVSETPEVAITTPDAANATPEVASAKSEVPGSKARKAIVGVLAFDLSAAFDTVSIDQLIPKLKRLGVSGRALKWFSDYLSGGRQQVCWDDALSSMVLIKFGVRQGSILGPLLFLVLVSDMARTMGVKEDEYVTYADDSNFWQTAGTVEEVIAKLTSIAKKFTKFTLESGLSLNAGKTQLLISSSAGDVSEVVLNVNGQDIKPRDVIEMLGVSYDRKFSAAPHLKNMLVATRQRAAVIVRLANHIPRGKFLRQLASGLVNGKLGHAMAAYASPRLPGDLANPSTLFSQLQVAQNRVARSIVGVKISDRVAVADLLKRAGILSVNAMTVRAVATEAWSCHNSVDGDAGGGRNFPGSLIFDQVRARSTRDATSGKVPVPLRGHDTFVMHAARTWNSSEELRVATSKSAAKTAANRLAARSPL
jgi:hypothetical protein